MTWLLEPYQFEFFRTGSLAALLAGALCGLLGVYIVLRGMSYIGHGLSHAIFGGAVVSFVMQWNFYIGAGLWGFFSALLINQTARRTAHRGRRRDWRDHHCQLCSRRCPHQPLPPLHTIV